MWTLTEYFIMGENLLKEIEKGSKMAVMKKKIITHYIYNGSSTITDFSKRDGFKCAYSYKIHR